MRDLTDTADSGGSPLKRWLSALWPGRCVACAADNAVNDLCAGCRADLQPNDCCCPRCAVAMAESAATCGRCLRKAPTFDGAWSPWLYAPPLDAIVLKLKFAGDLAAGRVLGRLWTHKTAAPAVAAVDVLVPIPLARDRLIERGYNQALELARPLAKRLQLPLRPDLLRRVRATAPQSGLDAKARRRNLSGAFAADPAVAGLRMALIDDVMTTGATMETAAKALKRAGAVSVQAWALARA